MYTYVYVNIWNRGGRSGQVVREKYQRTNVGSGGDQRSPRDSHRNSSVFSSFARDTASPPFRPRSAASKTRELHRQGLEKVNFA